MTPRNLVPVATLAGIVQLASCGQDSATIGDAPDGAAPDGALPTATPTDSGAPDPPADGAAGDGGATPTCTGKTKGAGNEDRKIAVGAGQRRFLLHVPKSYAPDKAMPLIVGMHGYLESPEAHREVTHYDDLSETRGFIVAYAEGTSTSWNAGVCCGTAARDKVDDVAFIKALILAVSADYCVDAKRVYASGFSNGGFMAHRLACEMSDVIAAVASGSGQLGVATCTPKRPIPVMQTHGTLDPIVPYNGSAILQYAATKDTIAGWVARNGCGATSTKTPVDGSTSCERWSMGCKGGADVELCTVEGGGHEWFGGTKWVGGTPPAGFVESVRVVEWFFSHPMP